MACNQPEQRDALVVLVVQQLLAILPSIRGSHHNVDLVDALVGLLNDSTRIDLVTLLEERLDLRRLGLGLERAEDQTLRRLAILLELVVDKVEVTAIQDKATIELVSRALGLSKWVSLVITLVVSNGRSNSGRRWCLGLLGFLRLVDNDWSSLVVGNGRSNSGHRVCLGLVDNDWSSLVGIEDRLSEFEQRRISPLVHHNYARRSALHEYNHRVNVLREKVVQLRLNLGDASLLLLVRVTRCANDLNLVLLGCDGALVVSAHLVASR